jgi:hypothetical protein
VVTSVALLVFESAQIEAIKVGRVWRKCGVFGCIQDTRALLTACLITVLLPLIHRLNPVAITGPEGAEGSQAAARSHPQRWHAAGLQVRGLNAAWVNLRVGAAAIAEPFQPKASRALRALNVLCLPINPGL